MSKKITISTDWHFGKSNGKFDHIILKGILEQCEHAKHNGITVMMNLGDTLDVKQTISTSTMNYLAKAFIAVNETFEEVYMLAGNHDMSKKTYNSEGHNLHIFSGYPNITVVDEAKIIEVFEKEFYMLPYFPNEIMKGHKFPKADYLMGHIEIQGFMLNQFVKAEEGINANAITRNYEKVFMGHFHKRQSRGKIAYIGNLCRFFYGEDDDERGWTVLDCESGEDEFIEFQHPRMYKFKMSTLKEQEDDLSEVFLPGDNLKLVIDAKFKYSEMEEFKSKLILDHGINELVLDDQMSPWDDLDLEDDDEESEDGNDKFETQSYTDYVIDNLISSEKLEEDNNAIKYLRELSKEYQE
jgi:DNA repair exonuclease SbcCD nuclease subunit